MHEPLEAPRFGKLVLFSLILAAVCAPCAQAGDWEWELVPYLWGPDASLGVSVNDTQVASATLSFADLVDSLEIGALVHFEGNGGIAGFFADVTYLELSDSRSVSDPALISPDATANASMDALLGELGATIRLGGADSGFALLLGARVFDLTTDVDFVFPAAADRALSRSETYIDGFAGLRYRGNLSRRWIWSLRADAGTGDTELSWLATVVFGWHVNEKGTMSLLFGYRHLDFEVEHSGSGLVESDLTFSGPNVGFRFGF